MWVHGRLKNEIPPPGQPCSDLDSSPMRSTESSTSFSVLRVTNHLRFGAPGSCRNSHLEFSPLEFLGMRVEDLALISSNFSAIFSSKSPSSMSFMCAGSVGSLVSTFVQLRISSICSSESFCESSMLLCSSVLGAAILEYVSALRILKLVAETRDLIYKEKDQLSNRTQRETI